MNTIDHKPCYGTMLPDADANDPRAGKAVFLEPTTPVGMVRQHLRPTANVDQWDDCVRCSEFDSCYRLCLARLQLNVVANG